MSAHIYAAGVSAPPTPRAKVAQLHKQLRRLSSSYVGTTSEASNASSPTHSTPTFSSGRADLDPFGPATIHRSGNEPVVSQLAFFQRLPSPGPGSGYNANLSGHRAASPAVHAPSALHHEFSRVPSPYATAVSLADTIASLMQPEMSEEQARENCQKIQNLFLAQMAESDSKLNEAEAEIQTERRLRQMTENHLQRMEHVAAAASANAAQLQSQVAETTSTLKVPERPQSRSRKKLTWGKLLAPSPSPSPSPSLMPPSAYNPIETGAVDQLKKALAECALLKADVCRLESLYTVALESRSHLFFENQMLQYELEDLTSNLFEEANHMVAAEKRLRDELQLSNKDLCEELEYIMQVFKDVTSQRQQLSSAARAISRSFSDQHRDVASSFPPMANAPTSDGLPERFGSPPALVPRRYSSINNVNDDVTPGFSSLDSPIHHVDVVPRKAKEKLKSARRISLAGSEIRPSELDQIARTRSAVQVEKEARLHHRQQNIACPAPVTPPIEVSFCIE